MTIVKPLGDIISFGPNAGRILRRWSDGSDGVVSDRLRPLCINLEGHGFKIHNGQANMYTHSRLHGLTLTRRYSMAIGANYTLSRSVTREMSWEFPFTWVTR